MTAIPTNAFDTLTAVGQTLLTAGLPLVGAWIGVRWQAAQDADRASRERRHKLDDDQAERDRVDAATTARRAFLRALLARHLEAYARQCAEVMWHNLNVEFTGSKGVPPFPEWPEVDWELLGADEMMRIRDIPVQVEMHKDTTSGNVYWSGGSEEQDRPYYAEGAAVVGTQAWLTAKTLREDAKVSAFEFPANTSNFAESMAEHLAELEEGRRIAAGSADIL